MKEVGCGLSAASDRLERNFERMAAARGSSPALIAPCGETVTYGELNSSANQLARHLRSAGVEPGSVVAVLGERSVDSVTMILAILKLGATFLQLEPSTPVARLRDMLQRSGSVALLTAESTRHPWLRDMPVKVLDLVLNREAISRQDPGDFSFETDSYPEGVSIIFTSGSTGVPQGVVGSHTALLNRVVWYREQFPYQSNEVCCWKSPPSFVDSLTELLCPLLSGVPVLIVPEELAKSPNRLVPCLAKFGVSRLVLVPTLLQALLDEVAELGNELPLLLHWICSGEVLTPSLALKFVKSHPQATLLNFYGSTEVTGDVTWHQITEEELDGSVNVPIGQSIANSYIRVLSPELEEVDEGEVGEVCVGGSSLALGYVDESNPGRFLVHPLSGERLYRTGDLGRKIPGGPFEYLGRLDHQVKVRGVRVELEEVESVLQAHTDVRRAVVVARQTSQGHLELVAYIQPELGELMFSDEMKAMQRDWEVTQLVPELTSYLETRLPQSMLPSFIVVVDEYPLSSSGKIDRRELSLRPAVAEESLDAAPATETEIIVHEVWCEALGLNGVGISTSFFEVGGHSLLAARIIARLEHRFGVEMPLGEFLSDPTIAAQAEWIELAQLAELYDSDADQLVLRV